MITHARCLGYDEAQSMVNALHTILTESEGYKVENGAYFVWQSPNGAQIWLAMKSTEQEGDPSRTASLEVVDLEPHFDGSGRMQAAVVKMVPYDESNLTGALYGWSSPLTVEDPESGYYPFSVDLRDFSIHLHAWRTLPRLVTLQIAAFAQEAWCFEDEQQYLQSDHSILTETEDEDTGELVTLRLAPQAMLPINEGASDNVAGNYALLTGRIVQLHRLQNPHTGKYFVTMLVDTYGGSVDVVALEEDIEGTPQVNGTVKAYAWLSAQVIPTEEG
ncbi:MAG: hypothetical protein C4335_12310 [Armatimonadota bacterium]